MKQIVAVVAGIALVFLASKEAQAACGKMEVKKGDVKVTSAGKSQDAKVNMKICAGYTIVTGKEGRAKIVMDDGNELNISPNTDMKIEEYKSAQADGQKKVLLNVAAGKVRSTVQEKYDGEKSTFQVKTKSAVAGVRGTDFLTGFNPATQKSAFVTFEGKVEVGKPGPGGQIMNKVVVGAGQQTSASPGAPPSPPQTVPPGDLKKMDKQSAPDGTVRSNAPTSDKTAGPNKKDGDKKSDGGDKKSDGGTGDKKPDGGGDKNADAGSGDKKADGGGKADSGGAKADSRGAKSDGGTGKADSGGGGVAAGPSGGGDTGGGPARSPAATGGGDTANAAPGPGGPAPGGPMGPSAQPGPPSMAGEGMAGGDTLGAGGGAPVPQGPVFTGGPAGNPIAAAPLPLPPSLPPMPMVIAPPVCDFCNQAVTGGNARVHINVHY